MGLILFSPFIIKYFFGKQFYHSIDILIIFIILKVLSAGFSSINPFFIAAGYVKYNTYITFITNIGFLVIIYFLCMRISLYGILIGFLFQIVVKFSVKIYILVKHRDKWLTSSI
jgi:O-antigen/teichoic acid export membrane protein